VDLALLENPAAFAATPYVLTIMMVRLMARANFQMFQKNDA